MTAFAQPPLGPLFAPRAARTSDPVTSHLAERQVTRSGARGEQAEAVYALVLAHPGSTSGELARASGRFDNVQVSRRLADLETAGRIAKGPSRICSAKGTRMTTWRPRA